MKLAKVRVSKANSIQIKRADLSDAAQIARLVTELGYATSTQRMRARMTAIAKEPNYSAFIAIDKGNAVGFIGTRIGPRFEGDGLYGQIMILIVTAKYRRKGVGLQLLKKAESELATHKASTVVVNTAEFRSDAQAFYEAAGYRYTGRRYRKEYLTNK